MDRIDEICTAKKILLCDLCGQEIAVGEKYHRQSGIYDGEFIDSCTCESCENQQGVIELIEKIYKNKYMVTCDNCGTGQECDSWADVMDFMNEEGWKKRLVDGEFKHYCPECQEGLR